MGWMVEAWSGSFLPAASLVLVFALALWCQARG